MDIYIYNSSVELAGIVDEYESLVWTRKFFEAGDFELTLPATAHNKSIVQKRRFVVKAGDDEVGYINSITVTDDSEKGRRIKAKGFMLHGIFAKRIIYANETSLAALITNNIISASDTNRNIPNFILNTGNAAVTFDYTVKGEILSEIVNALSGQNNFGQKTTIDKANGKFVYSTYNGTDHSAEQSTNPRVTFSKNYDNLLSSEYNYDEASAVNTIYADWDGTMKTITDGETHSAYDRYEGWKEFGGTTSLTDLTKQCNDALQEIAEDIEGDISSDSGYKTKWDLGDIVTVFENEIGFSSSKRITEITETHDNRTTEISCVFGSSLPTLSDKLKKTYKRG